MEIPAINDIIDNSPKSFNLIYCSVCKNIPEIKIENKGKEILFSKICKCKPELEKSINDLNKILFNNRQRIKLCQRDANHGIAMEFCTECLKWYCLKCSLEHNSLALNHITIKSIEKLEISPLCENENCKGKAEFYCKICLKNICKNCQNEHDKNHEIVIYEDFFKDNNIIKFKSNMKEVSNWINENNSKYSKIIEEIENTIKTIKELLEKN